MDLKYTTGSSLSTPKNNSKLMDLKYPTGDRLNPTTDVRNERKYPKLMVSDAAPTLSSAAQALQDPIFSNALKSTSTSTFGIYAKEKTKHVPFDARTAELREIQNEVADGRFDRWWRREQALLHEYILSSLYKHVPSDLAADLVKVPSPDENSYRINIEGGGYPFFLMVDGRASFSDLRDWIYGHKPSLTFCSRKNLVFCHNGSTVDMTSTLATIAPDQTLVIQSNQSGNEKVNKILYFL